MSFRRDESRANDWKKRLQRNPELVQRAGLPDIVYKDRRSWCFFIQEGCLPGTPLIDALTILSEPQQRALHELLSQVLSEQERVGTIWEVLEHRFRVEP
jgi:hypothetical protein